MLVRNLLGFSIYFKLFLPSLEIWTEISFINDIKEKSCLQTVMEEDFFLCIRSDVHELRHVWSNAESAFTQVFPFSLSEAIDLTCAVKLYHFRSMLGLSVLLYLSSWSTWHLISECKEVRPECIRCNFLHWERLWCVVVAITRCTTRSGNKLCIKLI